MPINESSPSLIELVLSFLSELPSTQFLIACISLVGAFACVILSRNLKQTAKEQHSILETIIQHVSKASDDSENLDFDDAIDNLIHRHHKQALLQSNIQFWFSLVAATIGFVFILAIVLFSPKLEWYEYLAKTIPGIIIEAISMLFFTQAKETREKASVLLNRLRQDRQYQKALKLICEIPDQKMQSELKAKIALQLCSVSDSTE